MHKQKLTTFEQALLDASLEDFADIPDNEDEIDVTFSPAFTEKAEKLVRNTQRKTWRYVNTTMKRLVVAAIIAALLATTAMAIPAVRDAIIKFFLHDEGTHYAVTFDPEQAANAPECIKTVYAPTYIPDGYHEDSRVVSAPAVCIMWYDSYGNAIIYNQLSIPEDPSKNEWYGINSENVAKEILYLNGYEVLSIYDDGITTYLWTDNNYFYDLSCYDTVSQEEMQKIFYSIKIDEDAVIEGAD